MTDFSRLSRFGMTYKPLTENLGEELLMSYRADFLVRTSAQLEKAQELTESEAECGEKWRASFTKYDLDTRSWKTHQCSLLEDLEEFLETWPQWGLMRDGECWEQRTLEQTIRGIGYGLSEKLPTPQATDHISKPTSQSWKAKGGVNFSLANPEIQAKWPTPTASQARSEGMILQMRQLVEIGTTTIEEAEAMIGGSLTPKRMSKWPTPVTRDYKDSGSQEALKRARDKRDSPGLALLVGAEGGGNLNPTWVEWLMGWPIGWTDLKRLETDKSHCVQQPHGES
jgi:hypothetical protein